MLSWKPHLGEIVCVLTLTGLRKHVIRVNRKRLISYVIVCWGFWYIFFNSSIILRPFYEILWPALVLFCLFLFSRKVIRYIKSEGREVFLCMLAYLLMCCISMLYTRSFSDSLLFTFRVFLAFGFVLVVASLDCPDVVFSAIKGYTFILFLISVIQLVLPGVYWSVFLPLVSMRNEPEVLNGLRQNLATGLTNGYGTNALLLCTGYCVFLSQAVSCKQARAKNIIISICFFVMIFLTGKRSYSVIAVGLFFLAVFYALPKYNRVVKILERVLLALLALIALLIANSQFHFMDSVINKFVNLSNSGDVSNGRLALYSKTFDIIGAHPLFGIGINAISDTEVGLVHNSYLQWIAEFGILGAVVPIVAFVAYPVYLLMKGMRLYPLCSEQEKFTLLASACLIVMYLVSGIVAATFQAHNEFLLYALCMTLISRILYWRKVRNL